MNEFMNLSAAFMREGMADERVGAFWYGVEIALEDPACARRMIVQAREFQPELAQVEHFEDVQATLRVARGDAE